MRGVILTAILLAVLLASCTLGPFTSPLRSPQSAPPTPPPQPQTLPSPSTEESITLIGDILADPASYQGQEVTVVAYYRGWDLLGEAGSGPPVTRSDVAVADATGSIYIVFAGEEALGDIPPLAPLDREATEALLRLHGVVRLNPNGQPYILVTKGEMVEMLPARVLLRVRRTGGIAGMDEELMAMADGTLYFLDRKSRTSVRWKVDPAQVLQAVEGLRPFLDREVGHQVPDGFAYAVTLQDGEKVRSATFYEGTLPEEADRALTPVREWFGEARERAARPTPPPAAYPGAVMTAIQALSERLNIPPEEVTVAAWEPVDWPDTSLGCPQPGMMYAQVIVPGYLVILEVRGETFRVHTDRAGQRFCFP
ncbi:MAG: hypothetical protein ACUVSG_03735 [Anaerolineae bacterium]